MKDPAGPPTWLLLAVLALWVFAFGVWRERHREGGTFDLAADVEDLEAENLRLLDELSSAEAARDRARAELLQRRNAAMHAHPSSSAACCDQRDVHLTLLPGGTLNRDTARAIDRSLRQLRREGGTS